MKTFLVIALAGLTSFQAYGRDCAPKEPIFSFLRWAYDTAVVDGDPVPADEVWKLRTVGIASNDPQAAEFMMQIKSPSPTGQCCWFHPLSAPSGVKHATPKFALEREVLLLPREVLGARTHVVLKDMAILYSGWRFDYKCLERLLGVERRSIDIDDK